MRPPRLNPQRLRRTLGAARCVRESGRFVAAELRGAPALATYRLRELGLIVKVRHPLLDMWVLEEVFRFGVYELPPAVRAALARRGEAPRVLDLGGHIGCFGLFLRGELPGARVISLEPDPRNREILLQCVRANALEGSWEVIGAAAGVSDGEAVLQSSFHLSRLGDARDGALRELQGGLAHAFPFLSGSELMERRSVTVQRRDIMPYLARADLVKMDIEGAEWEILQDPRFPPEGLCALVLEYHPAYATAPGGAAAAEERLRSAGFDTLHGARGADGGTLWAWRGAATS